MPHYPNKHHRRSIRLKGYDYTSAGAYFVTICVHGGDCALGRVVDGEMVLSDFGRVVDAFWAQVPVHFPNVSVEPHVTMPNHVHVIVTIHDDDGTKGGETQGGETPPLRGTRDVCRGAVSAPKDAAPNDTAPNNTTPNTAVHNVTAPNDAAPKTTPPGNTALKHPSAVTKPTLGQIVAYFKYQTTKTINQMRDTPGERFWQRNYWEHIIRNESAHRQIYEYITSNPARWENDQLHPDAPPNPFNQRRT